MTLSELPLVFQTTYAELIDQLRSTQLAQFAVGSTFRKQTVSGNEYWYVQEPTGLKGRPTEKYLGPTSPELDELIAAGHGEKRLADTRRTIVRSLLSVGLPKPDPLTGALLEALDKVGAFRLRGVLVGTVAFQSYAGILGIKLPNAAIRTADLDLEQDYGVSVALNDALELSFMDMLKDIDDEFHAVPSLNDAFEKSAYVGPGGYRVDVLTTNRGADRDVASTLPSLKTDATPLRYLDYLLRDPIQAAALTRHGTLITVPRPERYAIHKLIVATMCQDSARSAAKAIKDIHQAGILIDALIQTRRAADLSDAYEEAAASGTSWRKRLDDGAKRLEDEQLDKLRTVTES